MGGRLCRSPHGERGLKSDVHVTKLDREMGRSPHGERGLKLPSTTPVICRPSSLSSRRAWIEMNSIFATNSRHRSLSSRRAWIEILSELFDTIMSRRSPHGERGLKSRTVRRRLCRLCRSPHGERGLKWQLQLSQSRKYPVALLTESVD